MAVAYAQPSAIHPRRRADRYRPDLDGLRALAVIPVVLFHAGAQWLPGGFVGVDIFFVLSGFFITSHLYVEIEQQRYSLGRFYERRARRILPALFVMLFAVIVAAYFILLPDALRSFGKSVGASLLFLSNVWFWNDSGYFSQNAALKPLLHTWSLAVEEQYYILFPPILWFLVRRSRWMAIGALSVGTICSFGLGLYLSHRAPSVAFYLAPTRAWELLLGALLAITPWRDLGAPAREALSLGGLALIAAGLFLINEQMPFPGWVALAPCLGAAAIMRASLAGGGVGNRILQSRPLVFVGQISYSLYLWHWPPLALAYYVHHRPPSLLEAIAIVLSAVLAATLSWRFVEQPFRGNASRISNRQLIAFVATGTTVLALLAAAIVLSGGVPQRLNTEARRYLAPQIVSRFSGDCFNRSPTDVEQGRLCTIGVQGGERTFALWGDSHAGRVAVALDEIALHEQRSGWYMAMGSCPPLLGVRWPLAGCEAFSKRSFDRLANDPSRIVVLAGMWANYATGVRLGFNGRNSLVDVEQAMPGDTNERVFRRALIRTVDRLTARGKRVVIVGPIPEASWSVPDLLAQAAQEGSSAKAIDRKSFLERQAAVLDDLELLASKPNVVVVRPDRAMCDAVKCKIVLNGNRLYDDDNHLSAAGSRLIEPIVSGGFDKGFRP